MIDDRLIFAVVTRVIILSAALFNAKLAWAEYRRFLDVRGLRGYVASLTMLSGAAALGCSSPAIRDATPELDHVWIFLASGFVLAFTIGILFSTWTWLRPSD